MPNQIVDFNLPNAYQAEMDKIAYQQRLAEMLQKQSEDPIGEYSYKGIQARIPATAGLAKVLQALGAAYNQKKAQERKTELGAKYETDLTNTLNNADIALRGTPFKAGTPGSPEISAGEETVPGMEPSDAPQQYVPAVEPTSDVPAVKGSPEKYAKILRDFPGTRELGMDAMLENAKRARFINQLAPETTPTNALNPDLVNVSLTQKLGDSAGGIPMEIWLQNDPSGESYLKQFAKDNENREKLGMDQKTLNQKITEFNELSAYQKSQLANQGITSAIALADARIRGLNVNIPQAPQEQQPLDTRKTAQIQPKALSNVAGNQAPGASPVIPGPSGGMSQLQRMEANAAAEKEKTRQNVTGTLGQIETDKVFGKEYAEFKAGGGFADVQKGIVQLDNALDALKNEQNITGFRVGLQPDALLKRTNPRAAAVKNTVEEVVQRNLRLILGAQFTQNEGFKLIERAYDTAQGQPENAARVARLMTQMDSALKTKMDAVAYFEKNGTLRGWKGKIPTMEDFNKAVDMKTRTTDDAAAPGLSAAEKSELQELERLVK